MPNSGWNSECSAAPCGFSGIETTRRGAQPEFGIEVERKTADGWPEGQAAASSFATSVSTS